MRPRNLLILLVLVLALGAFLWFVERDLPGSEEREKLADKVLPQLADAELTTLTLEHGETRVRLVREAAAETGDEADEADDEATAADDSAAAEWRIAEPPSLAGRRADRGSVDALISALSGLTKERDVEDVDPAAVGLDAPRARVVVEPAEGGAVTLDVGGDVPASRGMVVGVTTAAAGGGEEAGEMRAYIVDRSILDDLTRAPGDWRAKDLFPAARGDVRRLSVQGEAGTVVLARGDDGAFRVVQPLEDRADRDAVDALLGTLVGLRAESFVDDADETHAAGLGLEPPRGVVVAGLDDGSEVRVEVGGEVGGEASSEAGRTGGGGATYLRVGDQVVTSSADLGEALQRAPGEWPSHRLTDLRLFEIDRLTVRDAGEDGESEDGESGGGEMTLRRDGADWTRDGEKISYTPVSDLLYLLTDSRAERVLPLAELRLRAPDLTLVLATDADQAVGDDGTGGDDSGDHDTGGEQPTGYEIRFHPARDGEPVPVTVSGRDAVLLVPAPTVAQIRDQLATLRAAEPLPKEVDELPEGVDVEMEEGDGEAP